MTLFGGECLECGKALPKCRTKYCSYRCMQKYRYKLTKVEI